MNMNNILFQTTDWSAIPEKEYAGETGFARWRTIQYPHFRMRIVEYSAGYKANHWCEKGHITYCLSGEFISELSDGRVFHLTGGMSYQVSDCASSHRSISKTGATLLIIDGQFLKQSARLFNPWKA
jgi:hypothetical protein